MIVEKMRKELELTATKKLKDQQLICSICGKNLPAEILAEHSAFCRRRMELRKELGNIHTNISNDIFNAVQSFREMSTKSRILKKDIQKQEQKLESTFTPSNRNSRDFGTTFTSCIEKQNISFGHKSAMSTCGQVLSPCDQIYENDNQPNLSLSRVSSDTTQNHRKIIDTSPQSTVKSSQKNSGKRNARLNTVGVGNDVDAIPEEEESSTPINRRSDSKFLTQEIKQLDIIEESDEINIYPKPKKLLRMQFEDEPEENEEKFTISLNINEPRVKTLKKKALASILDDKQYYLDSQLRKSNIPDDSSELTQKPSLIKKNSKDKGDDVILTSKSPQTSFIDDSFLSCEESRVSDIVIPHRESEESDEYPELAISRNFSVGSNKNISKSRFYVETRHSLSRFSKQGHEESMNTCFDDDNASLLERSEGKSLTSRVIDSRLSCMKREAPRFEQRKQIISKLKELRKTLANTYVKMEICGLIESTGKEFPSQEEFNIKMEIALKEAREKLEEIEKRYKNPIIYQTLDISHFFTHVEQLINKSKELSDIQRKMEQLEATEKKSPQQPLTKDGKSRSFRCKNGLKIAKLDIESAKQKMFDLSTQSPLTLSSQKSNRLVSGLSEESDASFDTGNSSSPRYTPKQYSKPNQLFGSESSPLLRSVQKKNTLNQSIFSSLYQQQQSKENTLDEPDETKGTASSRKSLVDETKISTTDEVINQLSSTLSGAVCSENEGQTVKILDKETILEKEPSYTKLLFATSDSGISGLKDSSVLEKSPCNDIERRTLKPTIEITSSSPRVDSLTVLSVPKLKMNLEMGRNSAKELLHDKEESELKPQPNSEDTTSITTSQPDSEINRPPKLDNNHQNQASRLDSISLQISKEAIPIIRLEVSEKGIRESLETPLEKNSPCDFEKISSSLLISKAHSADQSKSTSLLTVPINNIPSTFLLVPEMNQSATNPEDFDPKIVTQKQVALETAENPTNEISLSLNSSRIRTHELLNLKLKEQNPNDKENLLESDPSLEHNSQDETRNGRDKRKTRKRTGFFLDPKALLKANLANKYKQNSPDVSLQDEEEKGNLTDRAKKQSRASPLVMADFDDNDEIVNHLSLNESIDQLERGYYSDSQVKYHYWKATTHKEDQNFIGFHDFELIKQIGKGGFARVFLVRRIKTREIYAMKMINIAEKQNKKFQNIENLKKEKKVLDMLRGDFVVKAVFTFLHEQYICFVMENMMGGDFAHAIEERGCLDNYEAKFYIAEVVLAVEYLHSLGIIHRDLKPDNLLLDSEGHVKLTDFGLSDSGLQLKLHKSKMFPQTSSHSNHHRIALVGGDSANDSLAEARLLKVPLDSDLDVSETPKNRSRDGEEDDEKLGEDELTKTICRKKARLIGTPDYMAPEIIQGKSIKNSELDWWSLGVMIFEFLTGIPPFNDDSVDKIFDNIMGLKVPWDQLTIGTGESEIHPDAADLITKLLVIEPEKRLGTNGAVEIKKHPWFRGIDWNNLRKTTAPIMPDKSAQTTVSKNLGGNTINSLVNLNNEVPKMSNEEWATILKHLKKDEDSGFESQRFDLLDERNRKKAEEVKEEVKKEIDQMMKSYRERVGLQGVTSSQSDSESDGDTEFDPSKKSKVRRSKNSCRVSTIEAEDNV